MSALTATVIGAGPAGLSAAMGLARAGFRTRVTEQRLRWTGRVCGCFLSPEAVRHLEWLGVLSDARRSAVAVAETTLTWGRLKINVPIGRRDVRGLALPRQKLEEILIQRAQQDGVTIETGGVPSGGEPAEAGDVRVLAAGRFATVDKTATPARAWYGWNAAFTGVKQSPGAMSMHFYTGGYVGVVTFADGVANVCGLSLNPERAGGWSAVFSAACERSVAFAAQMSSATLIGEWRGVGPLPFSSSIRSAPNAVVVGDAAAVGDPFMGEGNSRALAAGPMLFNAVKTSAKDWTACYHAAWRHAYRRRLQVGAAMRWVLERPALAERALPALLRRPVLARRLSPLFHGGYFW